MDEYAMLLKLKSDYSKLNKLVHDLLNIDPARPEVFVALSVLWERKDEKRALSYAEQVSSFIFFIWIELFYLLQNCIQLTDYLVIRAFGSMRGIYQDI
jgi:hypothetical protein